MTPRAERCSLADVRTTALLCLLAGALGAAGESAPLQPPARPNVIFVLADDLAQGDLGCYGQQRIRTPHLDALARKGTRFEHCFSMALCGPSAARKRLQAALDGLK